MFTQSCFIRKNMPELRNKLEELEYKPFGSVKYEWDSGWGLSTDNRLGEFESFNNNGLENIIKCGPPDYENSIDCGTNEELFLALAALRDDNDYMQWFICDDNESMFKVDKPNMSMPKFVHEYMDGWDVSGARKATVKELIEHFK